jgi:hypothetical protein
MIAGDPPASADGTYPLTITAANGIAPDAAQSFLLIVGQAPSATSSPAAIFTTGVPGSFTITTTGFPTGAISETGALPAGLTFQDNHDGTAIIVGDPLPAVAGGNYPVTITISNGVGPSIAQNLHLLVNQSLSITSAGAVTFTVGTGNSFTMTTSSSIPTIPNLNEIGVLPNGVTFTDNGDGTATLSGTPQPGAGGVYGVDLTGTYFGAAAPDAVQLFTLTIDQQPAFFNAPAGTFTAGVPGSFTISTNDPAPSNTSGVNGTFNTTTSGGLPGDAALTETGSLPAGLTFHDNGDGTAAISGTPAAGSGGTYIFNLTASNGIAPDTSQSFTLFVDGPPSITSSAAAAFTTGTAGSFTITTSGLPFSAISESGPLPAGLTFADNHDGTATISGTPAVFADGTYVLSLSADNGLAPTASQSLTLAVDQPPSITSAGAATFAADATNSFTVTTTGFPSAAISESGPLPPGISFIDNGNGAATFFADLPATVVGGTYPLTLIANNGVEPIAAQAFTLIITQALTITSIPAATFTAANPGSLTITTASILPITPVLSEQGSLPPGVSFTDNGDGTATLSGTPAPLSGGVYGISIDASNGLTPDATQLLLLNVDEPPTFISKSSVTFTTGIAASLTISTGAGVPKLSLGPDHAFTLTTNGGYPTNPTLTESGPLPAGILFQDNGNGSATLFGTPAAGSAGTYVLLLTADNGVAPDATQTFTLTVL